jgi:hypothetical protein
MQADGASLDGVPTGDMGTASGPTLRFPSPQKIIDPNGPWYNLLGQVRGDGGVGLPLPPSRSR